MFVATKILKQISQHGARRICNKITIVENQQTVKVIAQFIDRRNLSTSKVLSFHITSSQLEKKNIVVPQLAESLSEGDIKFEKSIGDSVSEDDLIASIETDKTSVPVNSPVSGKIIEFLVEDSSTVKPGQSIIVIDTDAKSDGESVKAAPAAPVTDSSLGAQSQAGEHKSSSPPPPPSSGPTPAMNVRTEPAFAKPLSQTPVSTIKSELDANAKTKFGGETEARGGRTVSAVKMSRMRKLIADRLKGAQNTYAMLTTFNEIDMSNIIEMRQKYKEAFMKKHQVKLGFMSAFVKASQYALKDQPVVNAVIESNEIIYRDYCDISVAVATPKGLVVPVLRNVEQMNFADIEKTIYQLGQKAKDNALTMADMEGGTFTISNGGVFGSLFGTPIINPPQSAILGMHATNDRPVALNGQVVIRPVMVVALTYDHRLIDGREAVTFLKKIKEVIEDPRIMLLDL